MKYVHAIALEEKTSFQNSKIKSQPRDWAKEVFAITR